MNLHQNARLTPHGREWIVRQAESGHTPQAIATAVGVCPRTVRKWLKRYREEGLDGLLDRSSRPHRLYRPLSKSVVDRIAELRRQRWTGKQVAAELGVSPASVSRVLKRRGLNKLRALEPAEPVIRYERKNPGELIHLDIKKLGRFDRIGHRITGDRTGQSNSRGIGWEYVHVCIDDASRIAFSQILPDEKAGSAIRFLNAALAYYASLGVRVARVMTDNGPATRPLPSATGVAISASSTSAPNRTRPRPMERPNASSRPHCANGPMLGPITPHSSGPPNCRPGCIATTGTDLMVA